MKLLFIFIAPFFLPGNSSVTKPNGSGPISHEIWDGLLKNYVSPEGKVNYKGFLNERSKLKEYLDLLNSHPPLNCSNEEKLAYWINAYNAFTVELILQHYPLKSIRDIKGGTPWKIDFFSIGAEKFDLDKIEHEILRKQFNEPRIHFAINCASVSCPVLRNEAYTAAKLNVQLEQQTKRYINDTSQNLISENEAKLSEIFNWFKGDFTKKGTLPDFINKYSGKKINPNASISYLEYDWRLNE